MGGFPSVVESVIPENRLFTDSHRHTRGHVMQPSTGTRAWRTAGSAGTHAGMRRSPHWNNCQTFIRKFFLVLCWDLPPLNPTLWSPRPSSRSTYSAPTCSRQMHQTAGAQLPSSPVPQPPLPHLWFVPKNHWTQKYSKASHNSMAQCMMSS